MSAHQRQPVERRTTARVPSDIPAVVHTVAGDQYEASIANFCLGGMLLQFARSMPVHLRPGQKVEIEFQADLRAGPVPLSVSAVVRHVHHDAVGVQFTSLSVKQRIVLQSLAETLRDRQISHRAHEEDAGEGSRLDGTRLQEIVRELWGHFGLDLLQTAFETAEEEYLQRSEALRDPEEKAQILHELNSLQLVRNRRDFAKLIERSALKHLDEAAADLRPRHDESADSAPLSLVGHEEVEDWLAKDALANRITQEHEAVLRELRALLVPVLDENAPIPLGPESLAGILDDMFSEVGLVDKDRRRLLWTLGRPLARLVGPLYAAYQEALENEAPAERDGRKPAVHKRGEATHSGGETRGPEPTNPSGAASAVRPADTPRVFTAAKTTAAEPANGTRDGAAVSDLASDALTDTEEHLRPLFEALNRGSVGQPAHPPEKPHSLASWRTDTKPGPSTRAPMANRLAQAADLIRHLEYGLCDEHIVTSPQSRQWLARLTPRLGEALFTDPSFLAHPGHPLREIVDRLDRLGCWTQSRKSADDRRTILRIEQLIDTVLTKPNLTAEDWERLSRKLSEYERRHLRRYTPELTARVLRSVARQRAEAAERAVAERLRTHFSGRRTHRLVAGLLDSGWTAFLATVYLEHGPDSLAWRRAWENMETLEKALAEDPAARISLDSATRHELLADLSAGLERVVLDPLVARESLSAIRQVLSSESNLRARTHPAEFIRYEPPAPDPQRSDEPPQGWDEGEWKRQLQRLRTLRPGKTVRVRDRHGRPHELQVAWADPEGQRFVCVDHSSGKVRSLTLSDLGRVALRDMELQITASDRPLAERLSAHILDRLQKRIREQVCRDPLTGLFNRRHIMAALRRAVERTEQAVFCILDLENFSVVNNSYGSAAGDQLLRDVAEMLTAGFGKQATIARVGSDEFALLFAESSDERDAEALARDVLDHVRRMAFRWNGRPFSMNATIGVALVTDSDLDPDAIYNAADSALQVARRQGGDRVRLYRADDTLIVQQQRISYWVVRIQDILAHDRLRLRRQKIQPLHAAGYRVPSYEVLLTASDERGEAIPTIEFVRAAEECNSMPDVDRWVISRTLAWLAAHPPGSDVGHYALNLSGQSLRDPRLIDFLVDEFEKTGAPRNKVAFEITETAAMERLDEATRTIQALRDLGCSVALDDFGTGLSSYAYLQSLPVDQIKIDGLFVRRINDRESDLALVSSINELAHFMGKETVAEYVETQEIHEALVELGVDYAQGHWIERSEFFA